MSKLTINSAHLVEIVAVDYVHNKCERMEQPPRRTLSLFEKGTGERIVDIDFTDSNRGLLERICRSMVDPSRIPRSLVEQES